MLEGLDVAPHGAVAAQAPAQPLANLSLAVVGMSISTTCGMRDHATMLRQALEREGGSCSMHWLARGAQSYSDSRKQVRAWANGLARELAQERPAAVLLHYSPFAYGHRGVPVCLHSVLGAIRRA